MQTFKFRLPTLTIERKSSLQRAMFVLACFLIAAGLAKADYHPNANKVDSKSTDIIWHDRDRDRDVPARIYYPVTSVGKLPIIIFSHGLGGSREGYSYLGQYWASHGYVVVHLTHHGSDTEALFAGGAENVKQAAVAIAADPMNAVDRCRDVSFAISRMIGLDTDEKSPLKDHLDTEKIGMAGHSFGGNTTMLIAGEQTRSGHTFADDRVKAAIAMSPPVPTPKAQLDQAYANVAIPLFVMTGTKDDSPIGETRAADRRAPFDHVQKIPAYLITFAGGDHMLFSGRRVVKLPTDDHYQDLILQGTLAFWDAYLRSDSTARKWLELDYAKVVGDAGKFEQRQP